MYIDGVADGTNFNYTTAAMGITNNRSTIGALGRTSYGTWFTGAMFDFRIYSRALTLAEVHTLYAATQRI